MLGACFEMQIPKDRKTQGPQDYRSARGQWSCGPVVPWSLGIWVLPFLKQILCLVALSGLWPVCAAPVPTKTENVFLITIDGFRWQEVFRGAEALLLDKTNGGVADAERLKQAFWRDSPEARRQALLP